MSGIELEHSILIGFSTIMKQKMKAFYFCYSKYYFKILITLAFSKISKIEKNLKKRTICLRNLNDNVFNCKIYLKNEIISYGILLLPNQTCIAIVHLNSQWKRQQLFGNVEKLAIVDTSKSAFNMEKHTENFIELN